MIGKKFIKTLLDADEQDRTYIVEITGEHPDGSFKAKCVRDSDFTVEVGEELRFWTKTLEKYYNRYIPTMENV